MTNPTTNFGWVMPSPTDLVTDLPADFEVFGQAVDTDFVDLLGGANGYILSKASAADLDFAWIPNDQGDITAVNVTSPITGGGSAGAVTIGINAATTSVVGAVQLSDSTSTTSSVLAATPTAVKAAYDKASTAATTSVAGIVQLSDSTSTTSSVLASTPTATKSAYDLADAAIAKSTLTTAGDIVYRNATVPVRLGIGTSGQVLKVNSGGTAPEWVTSSSGSLTLLSTTTLSTATTTVSSISQAYKHLYIEILGIDVTAFNPTINYLTNSTAVVFNVTQAAAATGVNYYSTAGTVGNGQNYAGNYGVNKAAIWLYDYTDAVNKKVGSFNQYWINEGGSPIYFNGQFLANHTAAMTSFSMTVSTGSYDSGTIKVYGVN